MKKEDYDDFKNNNLPTPFYNNKKEHFEYVNFIVNELQVNDNLIYALGDLADTDLYFSYTSKYFIEDEKTSEIKIIKGHCHSHLFDDVVRSLYNFPESFEISKEEEQFYSKVELSFLKRIQKYLLFLGMKDLENVNDISRYNNKNFETYKNTRIYKFDDDEIKNILENKLNFYVTPYYENYKNLENYDVLIVDSNEDFKLHIEIYNREEKKYKEVKQAYTINDLNDQDKVIVTYFNILKVF